MFPINDLTLYALHVTSVFHMLLMMLGLAERVVRAEQSLLQTVLRNLVENAVKYRSPADAEHPVTLTLEREDNQAVLTIANDIDPAVPFDRSRLFERHTRDATRGNHSSLGLGLYLVQRIIHDMQGSVVIAEVPAHQFILTLRLPTVAP